MRLRRKLREDGASSRRPRASSEELAVAFDRYRDTLTRLALFLTGRSDLAQSCVIDASLANTSCNQVFVDWLENWARYSTIAAAIRLMRDPIDEAARSYEGRRCTCPSHTVQASELVSASEVGPGGARLDALARFAVVLRGIERKPVSESALLLGIPAALVETAYCAALQVLRIHPVARRTQSA